MKIKTMVISFEKKNNKYRNFKVINNPIFLNEKIIYPVSDLINNLIIDTKNEEGYNTYYVDINRDWKGEIEDSTLDIINYAKKITTRRLKINRINERN